MLEGAYLAAAIAQWMTREHYPEPIKRALLHRIQLESGFQPNATSPGRRYRCLVQWDSQRYQKLLIHARYVPTKSKPCPEWDKQMGFMHHELTTVPQYQVVWRASPANARYVVTAAYFGGAE